MPKASKRTSQSNIAIARRWSKTKIPNATNPSNVNISDINDLSDENTSDSSDSSDVEDRMDIGDTESNFSEKLLLADISGLAEMCRAKCGTKYRSTLLYISLRFFNVKWEDIDQFLNDIDFMTAQTSHK